MRVSSKIMVCQWQSGGGVQITHKPTGETVFIDFSRSVHKNREMGLKVIRSRLWALQHGIKRPELDDVISEYNLPDDVEYPNDLEDYRKSLKLSLILKKV